jgi:phospholipid transport system substrate-binding protein
MMAALMDTLARRTRLLTDSQGTAATKSLCRIVLILIVLAVTLHGTTANAGAPTDQVRSTVDQVLAILQDPSLKTESKEKERRDQLRRVIFARFDFTEMARRSLGPAWRRRSPAEQQEFVAVFTDLLQDNYIGAIESYSGDQVSYNREIQDKDNAEVQTTLTTKGEASFSINYRLHLVGKDWKVYDVVIENISVVNNYRSQFSRVISRSSYGELVRAMKEKAESNHNGSQPCGVNC